MNVVIYQCLIIHIIVLFYGVPTHSIFINGSKGGLIGENGTEIECSYTPGNYIQLSVSFLAFNKSSAIFDAIALYIPDQTPILIEKGQYLKGRVTLTPITQSSTKAVLTFNKLMCIDDTFYKCKVFYQDANGPQLLESGNISISVQVPPSNPDNISLFHTPAVSSVITTNLMDYSSSPPSTAVTSKENETVSASPTDIQSTNTAMQTTGHDTTTSTPYPDDDVSSNVNYKATTYSIQQTTAEQVIAAGDTITVVCTGDVGKPPAEHIFQKYRSGHTLSMNFTPTETSISEIPKNCSFYRTSNITFQVTAADNNAVIRCVVISSMTDPDMYVETEQIEVHYEVSEPTITKYPNEPYYVVGENTSILLTCNSDGNPKPNYQWYKDNMLINTNESLTITDMNITNSGIYICNVTNTFNGDTHRNAKDVHINIMNKVYTTHIIPEHSSTLADISTTQSSSIGSSSGVDKKVKKSEGNLGLVAGIVGAVVAVIVVIIVIIACKRRKSKSPTSKNVSNNFDDSKPKPVTQPRTGDYDFIALDDDVHKTKSSNNGLEVEDIKKQNEEYLKKQEEEEKKKNESNTPPQPAVYAQVNEASKLKNKQKTETQEKPDKQEEDPYAETQDDVYDEAGNPRYKENKNAEQFDVSTNSSKHKSNDDNKLSIQTSQVGSYANQGFEKDENRKVATVSPTVRSSSGSQNDEQTNSNRNSQSKKEYENIIGADQTGKLEEESSHRTAL